MTFLRQKVSRSHTSSCLSFGFVSTNEKVCFNNRKGKLVIDVLVVIEATKPQIKQIALIIMASKDNTHPNSLFALLAYNSQESPAPRRSLRSNRHASPSTTATMGHIVGVLQEAISILEQDQEDSKKNQASPRWRPMDDTSPTSQ